MNIISNVTSMVRAQITNVTRFMATIQGYGNRVMLLAQQKIQQFFQTLFRAPSSKNDYWRFFGLYFAKKFVVTATIVVGFLLYLLYSYVYPKIDGWLWTSNMNVDSAKFSTFSGRARAYDTGGILVYEGQMNNGKADGYGVQYDKEGNLVYKGNFKNSKYEGEGELYTNEGLTIYSGNFSNNRYDGKGKLYNNLGKLIYVGNFEAGQRSGKGIEYEPKNAVKQYYGEFANDKREGKGVEFADDGDTIVYEGQFKDGVYSGKGNLYQNKVLLYAGYFDNGLYHGTGDLYDVETGVILYSGEFKNALFDGSGKFYDVNTGNIVYEGSFSQGKRQGKGTSYDSIGTQTFEGTFKGDSIDYVKYLGKGIEDVSEDFGQESYRYPPTDTNLNTNNAITDKLILTYLDKDVSVVFSIDKNSGEYACEKIILGTKEKFLGLSSKSTAVERRAVMGSVFSAINYSLPAYYNIVLSHLSINIKDTKNVPSDKYVFGNYYVRFYFNAGKTELKFVEISIM